MGNTASVSAPPANSTGGGKPPSNRAQQHRGKKIIGAKLASAEKTGVLNLSDQDIKPASSVWPRLIEPELSHKLKMLDISSNQLKVLPLEVYGLGNLKTLNASNCNIQSLHDMTTYVKMTNLKLSVNDLEEHTVHSLPPNLHHLYLAMNHFRTVPTAVTALRMIVVLDLSGNRLQNLNGLEELTLLSELYLNDNALEGVPAALGALTKLTFLNLENNKIGRTANFASMNDESEMKDDHDNVDADVQSIAKEVFTNTAVVTLQLAGNPITTQDLMTFEGMDAFLDRWKGTRDKLIQGGAMLEQNLFGLS